MTVIALTGGIGSGKSTIGRRLEALGAVLIDADRLARDAVAPGSPGLARVRERFGASVIAADGSLDRAALGAVVFAAGADPELLTALNGIVHPEVARLYREAVDRAVERDPAAVIVYEIPLLVESGRRKESEGWDLVVTASAPIETRVRRLADLRGFAESDARGRIANQSTDEEREALADVIIDTSGTEEDTISQVDDLWRGILRSTARPQAARRPTA